MFKVKNKNTRTTHRSRSGVFINFKHISHFFLVFLLMTLNKQMFAGLGVLFKTGLEHLKASFPSPKD